MTGSPSKPARHPPAKPPQAAATSRGQRPWRILQFRLRSLLLLPVVFAVAWVLYTRGFDDQRQVADYLREQGGTVTLEPGGFQWLQQTPSAERFQDVVHVDLADVEFDQESLDRVLRLPRLQSLIVGGEDFSDEHLARLAALDSLEVLILDTTGVTSDGVRELEAALPRLMVRESKRRAIAAIHEYRARIKTSPTGPPLLRERFGEEHFADAVQYVCLADREMGSDGFALLRFFPETRQLYLMRPRVGDAGLRHIAAMSKLEVIKLTGTYDRESASGAGIDYLSDTRVTSRTLEHLAALPNLQILLLRSLPFDDRDLRHLQELPKLQGLVLHSVDVTDSGLEMLHSMPQLKSLNIIDTPATEKGIDRLRQALPECQIKWVPPAK